MDTTTREIVQHEKATRREARAAERERQSIRDHEAWQLDWNKRQAVRDVDAAATAAAERLSVEPSKWASKGTVVRVCNWTGPHNGFWCLFHQRKLVTLVKIPNAKGSCWHCSRNYRRHHDFNRAVHLSIYLGSNGKLYRYGHTKIFKAKLMDRNNEGDIRALIPKLNAME